MKRVLIIIPFLLLFHPAFSNKSYDTLLNRLNDVLAKKNNYDNEKIQRITNLEKHLTTIRPNDLAARYTIYLSLYDEYKSFNYDKAFDYAQKLQRTGLLLHNPAKIAYSKVKLGFILLSSGMFKEAIDSLHTVNVKLLDQDGRKEYYFLNARTYYDLADFDKDNYYTPIYNTKSGQYIDSATQLCASSSFEYIYYM